MHYPLVCMFCCRRSNFLVNYICEKALRAVYDYRSSSYAELIMVKNEPTIHHEDIKLRMKEILTFENDQSASLIDDIFQVQKNTFNLRHLKKLQVMKNLSKNESGDNILSCTTIVDLVPTEIKESPSLSTFKEKVKIWD